MFLPPHGDLVFLFRPVRFQIPSYIDRPGWNEGPLLRHEIIFERAQMCFNIIIT